MGLTLNGQRTLGNVTTGDIQATGDIKAGSDGTGFFKVDSNVADGSGAVYMRLNTENPFTTAGATWQKGESAGTERWSIEWAPCDSVAFKSQGRLDIFAGDSGGSQLFFSASGVFFGADANLSREGDATSGANQFQSYPLVFGNSTWDGSASKKYFHYIRNLPTAVQEESRFAFFVNDTVSTGSGGTEVLSLWDDQLVGIGRASTIPVAKVDVIQPSSSGAVPVLRLEQADIDDSFVDYVGTSAADGTRSLSSDTTEDAAKTGAFRIEVNGTTRWVRHYADES